MARRQIGFYKGYISSGLPPIHRTIACRLHPQHSQSGVVVLSSLPLGTVPVDSGSNSDIIVIAS